MSAVTQTMGLNEDHVPNGTEEDVLQAFKREREEDGAIRMSPQLIRDRLDDIGEGTSKQNVNYALSQLTAAGWIEKKAPGIYEFVDDPRDT